MEQASPALVSKQARALFAEKTNVSSHFFSPSEQNAFLSIINSTLQYEPIVKHLLPMPTESKQIQQAVENGVLLCKFLEKWVPGSIQSSKINISPKNKFDMLDNHTLMLNTVKRIQCKIGYSLRAMDMFEIKPHLLLALIWQILQTGLRRKIYNTVASLQIEKECAGLTTLQTVLFFFNSVFQFYHIDREIKNFTTDIRDCVAYIYSLHYLVPDQVNLDGLEETNLHKRAENLLETIKKLGFIEFITVDSIIMGNQRLNSLFSTYLITNAYALYSGLRKPLLQYSNDNLLHNEENSLFLNENLLIHEENRSNFDDSLHNNNNNHHQMNFILLEQMKQLKLFSQQLSIREEALKIKEDNLKVREQRLEEQEKKISQKSQENENNLQNHILFDPNENKDHDNNQNLSSLEVNSNSIVNILSSDENDQSNAIIDDNHLIHENENISSSNSLGIIENQPSDTFPDSFDHQEDYEEENSSSMILNSTNNSLRTTLQRSQSNPTTCYSLDLSSLKFQSNLPSNNNNIKCLTPKIKIMKINDHEGHNNTSNTNISIPDDDNNVKKSRLSSSHKKSTPRKRKRKRRSQKILRKHVRSFTSDDINPSSSSDALNDHSIKELCNNMDSSDDIPSFNDILTLVKYVSEQNSILKYQLKQLQSFFDFKPKNHKEWQIIYSDLLRDDITIKEVLTHCWKHIDEAERAKERCNHLKEFIKNQEIKYDALFEECKIYQDTVVRLQFQLADLTEENSKQKGQLLCVTSPLPKEKKKPGIGTRLRSFTKGSAPSSSYSDIRDYVKDPKH